MPKVPWRVLTEKIVAAGAATAEIEFRISMGHGRSTAPTSTEFRERALLRSSEIVNGREPYLKAEFAPFRSFFNQCMIAIKKREDPSLEKLIDKEYRKLKT